MEEECHKGQYQRLCETSPEQLRPTGCFITQTLIGQARTGGSPGPDDGSNVSNGPVWKTEDWDKVCQNAIDRVKDTKRTHCGNCPKQDRIKPLVEDLTSQKRAAGELI